MIICFGKGGIGSGNHNHTGRHGIRGGSSISSNQKIINGLPSGESSEFMFGNAIYTTDLLTIRKILGDSLRNKEGTQSAVNIYQDESASEGINDSIRTNYIDDELREVISTIDTAMCSVLNQDTILTRIVGKEHPMYDAISQGKNAVNTVYTEKAYSSTSISHQTYFGSGNDVKVRILAEKGTKGMSFAHELDLEHLEEYEFCLPRECAFEVTAMNYDKREVFVRLIDNGVTK